VQKLPEVIAKERLGGNRYFDVFLEDIAASADAVVPDYLVVRPKVATEDLITGVSVLPVCGNRIGLLEIYRHAIAQVLWEVPRGFIDEGEAAEDAARRELLEEIGIAIPSSDLMSLGVVSPEPGLIAGRVQMFLARDVPACVAHVSEEFGHEGLGWLAAGEALELINTAKIQDPATVISIYRWMCQSGLQT